MLNITETPHQQEDNMKKAELDAMNVKNLAKLISDATARLNEIKSKEIQEERQRIQDRAEELGVSIYELLGLSPPGAPRAKASRGNGTRRPSEPKYKLPDGNLWGGRGRLPLSLRDALKGSDGYDPETAQFATKEQREAALRPFLIQ